MALDAFCFGASDNSSGFLVATRSGLNVNEEMVVCALITLLGSEGLKI